jgi:short-subunit dehydrogenase
LEKPETPSQLAAEINKRKIHIDYLVNNAGYSLAGRFTKHKWAARAAMIQCMLTAVTELCYIFAPQMAAKGEGYIVNVASAAAFLPGSTADPLYGPVKSYVKKLSQSLYQEYKPQGVNIVASCPGYTYTEIHDVAGTREAMNRLPKFIWLQGPTVVRESHIAVINGKGPVLINGWPYRLVAFILNFIPDNLLTATRGPKKDAAKGAAPKPAETPVHDAPLKKPQARKAPAKKPAAKKPAAKKPAAKKPAAKKPVAKKPAVKKQAAKAAAKKTTKNSRTKKTAKK